MQSRGAEAIDTFVERGWMVVDLPRRDAIDDARAQLVAWLQAGPAPLLRSLDQYHRFVDDEHHRDVLWMLSSCFWAEGLARRVVEQNLGLFEQLAGGDLHVQRYPYLRIARPGRPSDVTGIHRDTLYGASPYELSMVVPFTDVPEPSAVRVVSGSHAEPATAYPSIRRQSPDVTPGSRAHQLGFPYAPRELPPQVEAQAEPVPLRVGQALVFGLALVHGQAVNTGETTRVSADIRVVNSLAPVRLARGVRADYYEPLTTTPLTRLARRYPDLDPHA